jgi:hypothetical protein
VTGIRGVTSAAAAIAWPATGQGGVPGAPSTHSPHRETTGLGEQQPHADGFHAAQRLTVPDTFPTSSNSTRSSRHWPRAPKARDPHAGAGDSPTDSGHTQCTS